MHEIERLEELAEEARLFYVAVTRARDRLVVTGPRAEIGSRTSYAEWLAHGVAADVPVAFRDPAEEIRSRRATAPPRLEWLDRLRLDEPSALVKPLPEAELAWVHSATELMLREQDAAAWERRYRHGIEPSWRFAPETGGDGAEIPPTVRGTVIHGVLERIEEARELSRILDETIGALDEPELEPLMAPGTRYRETLEKEIEAILASEEWRGYVEGEHWRELEFFHLVGERNWRLGAFDLYRPREESADLIVDFKTHPIGAGEVEKVAREYRVQARIYAAAGEIAGPVSVRLHFTYPNVVVEAL